ncbi:Transposase DNA binding site ISRme3 [Mycoavidus cysteinexigens]|uniref:Transposase DNA binding site ISRme3 n=1 Tax=Mycoavidus cysteinexigens TaxID=1553431 RepID=A0A2Z6ETD1_9BURK|nr:Transposase DNA binding site ISRme3 [Mycoavidus cysteinexigens]GLR01486.1 transposase [Mycoavidus cysteinexigens]
MSKIKRARYTLEYKLEAMRLVANGQSVAAVARILGIADQTLHNWIKVYETGSLVGASSRPISAEQMEISRLRAELARVKMEHDILKKAAVSSTGHCNTIIFAKIG